MSDEEFAEGTVPVRVSKRDVHIAVRNVMKNELRIDADALTREAKDQAKALVAEKVDAYLKGNGYDTADLAVRVKQYADHYLKADMKEMIRQILKEEVLRDLHDQALAVVEGVVREGLELKVGWNRTIRIKTTEGKDPFDIAREEAKTARRDRESALAHVARLREKRDELRANLDLARRDRDSYRGEAVALSARLERLERKVEHGCTNAACPECDGPPGDPPLSVTHPAEGGACDAQGNPLDHTDP